MKTPVMDPPVRSVNPRRISAGGLITPSSHIIEFGSHLFPTKALKFESGRPEIVVIGGRRRFPFVHAAFEHADIKQILFVGWGSQGPAQAPNLRDTLKSVGSDIKVCVGLRPNSKHVTGAIEQGFNYADGTLGDIFQLASTSDLVICLIADGGMVEIYQQLFKALKPGAIVGISHGFLVGHLKSIGQELPLDHDFIMVAPKGMGPSVRKLYLQGLETEGAGINSSVAVQPRSEDRYALVREVANAWSVGIGSPVTFSTTFMSEVTSDLFGERSMLLAGLWGMAEGLYEFYADDIRHGSITAFQFASSGITGTITDMLSELGIQGFYNSLTEAQKLIFNRGYAIGYPVFDGVMDEIYQSVSSLSEIKSVIEATKNLHVHPMNNVEEKSPMWKLARAHKLYGEKIALFDELVFSAGIYISGLMAQMQTLLHHGHPVSEVINESFIEAINSLTPYMNSRGVAFMVDGCSTTARLGTRVWGPVFRAELLKALRSHRVTTPVEYIVKVMRTFNDASLHNDVTICMNHRPSVRIDVPLE